MNILLLGLLLAVAADKPRYEFADPVLTVEWVQVKTTTEQFQIPVINGLLPEINHDQKGRYFSYRYKIPYDQIRKDNVAKIGYLDYRSTTPDLIKLYSHESIPVKNNLFNGSYVGPWKTSQLNGTMQCDITAKGTTLQGRFFGNWRGIDFDYNEDLLGTPDNLSGTANIDGENYKWRGSIKDGVFKANFTSGGNTGFFELRKK